MDVLILSCTGDESPISIAALIMDSVGSSYTILSQAKWGSSALQLTNADGSGKYYAIVTAADLACWSADQQIQISSYEIDFHVKNVFLYSYPYTANGVSPSSTLAGGALTGTLTYAPAMTPFATSLNTAASIAISQVWV